MPKENKHARGRREDKKSKRKREDGDLEEHASKRRKSHVEQEQEVEFIGLDNVAASNRGVEEEGEALSRPFYGMLEDEEQEYFRRADELLELNDFPSSADRDLFLANVYREAEGKELKIACSQSCSRLMERLMLLSTVEQKKKLFAKFSGNFTHLVQHRFASHCCETLFIQSAPVVTQELTADSKEQEELEKGDEEVYVSMENLFLYTLNELEGQMSSLLTDRFASHTLRVLLIILSGRPLENSATRTLLQSKKKEKISVTGLSSTPTELTLHKRSVPESFTFAVEKIISDTIATMDQSFIRVLATHPTGNPSLQLLLELELTNPSSKKGSNAFQKTLISALLPDDISAEGSESAVFVNGILYDPIGSRLLETIMTYAPGKLFKQIYRTTFKERISALARNEIASYVVIKVLNRISKEDLEDAVVNIAPHLPGLVSRFRTVVLKTLLERCHARGARDSILTLTNAISDAYGGDPSTLILNMACIDDVDSLCTSLLPAEASANIEHSQPEVSYPPKPTPAQLHGSLLAQSMLSIPGPPSELIHTSLLALSSRTLLTLALYTTTSHIIQAGLNPSSTTTNLRRKILNTLLFPPPPSQWTPSTTRSPSPVLTLALSATGSHTLDAILPSSLTLFSLIERIATELSTYETVLRESYTGRIVWRNLSLDLFKRRRGEWVKLVKEDAEAATTSRQREAVKGGMIEAENSPLVASVKSGKKSKANDEASSKSHHSSKHNSTNPALNKSAIQLAREKFAAEKARKETWKGTAKKGKGRGASGKGIGTGVNAIVT